jgi:ATP-binding protein involved in chromosome partitioning
MSGKIDHPITEEQVRAALQRVKFPGFSRDIVSFGLVKSISVGANNDVTVALQITSRDPAVPPQIQKDAESALSALAGIGRIDVQLTAQQPAQPTPMTTAGGMPEPTPIEGVKRIIAVGSGKGGVGKTTVAVNLACALNELGHKVGLMDADIYGPSVPKMLGATEQPNVADNDKLDPVDKHGLKLMSMALLMDPAGAVIWRGPMIMKAIQEFSHAVNWGALDVLVVDLPPGTGDAQISLAQTLPLDGGIIVTTPQDVALEVARRGITMFEKVNVKILGIIENMSYYVCPHCGQHDDVFGHGGAKREAERLKVPFLGELPLNTEIRAAGDSGVPIIIAAPDSAAARAFKQCAEAVWSQLENN